MYIDNNYLYMFLILLFLTSLNALQTKICAQCKYFIYNEQLLYGKCSFFPKIEPEDIYQKRRELLEFLVTGYEKPKVSKPTDYYFCSTVRDCEHMCGKEGKKYQEKTL